MAEVTQQKPSKISGGPVKPRLISNQAWASLGIVVIVIIAAVGGFYYHRHHQSQQIPKNEPYFYTYSKLSSYKLSGAAAGSGVKFNMPAEFGPSASSKPVALQADFSHTLTRNSLPATVSSIAVSSTTLSTPPTATYIKNLGEAITNPKDPNYAVAISSLETFVTTRLDAGYSATFTQPKVFTDSSIKTNAWSINFAATFKTSQQNPLPEPPITGEAIMAIGQKTYYYYYIDAVNYNWTGNQTFWNQVVGSLKIDQ